MSEGTTNFFNYARERYDIFLRRGQGANRPWTDDPILQEYRFCNVFREDDIVTQWIAEYVREPLRDDERVVLAMVVARWFNRVTTLEKIHGQLIMHDVPSTTNLFLDWNPAYARKRLKDHAPLVTGAYMVKTPAGMNKLEGLLECIGLVAAAIDRGELSHAIESGVFTTLREATSWLAQFPYLGPFMAYEVVTDLRHTSILENATDIMTWANPGPGAARGAGRVLGHGPDHFDRNRAVDHDLIQVVMQRLLENSNKTRHWLQFWPSWEMRDVEHTLCEFDKYERARLNEGTPKQRYNGGGDV